MPEPITIYPADDAPMAKARRKQYRAAAVRALDDPATIARAARITREALARKRITLADVAPDDEGADE